MKSAMVVVFLMLARISAIVIFVAVAAIIAMLIYRGFPAISLSLFFGDTPFWQGVIGTRPVWDGIWPACVGTLSLVLMTLLLVLFPGIGCGLFLAKFATVRQRRWLGCAIDILAGIPSIVMGLFGFSLIVMLRHTFWPQANTCLLLAAGCLALLVLPSLVMATREAILALPAQLQLTGAALGLNRRQCLRYILLPAASRGILSGVILTLGRTAEDTAVILLTGVVAGTGFFAGPLDKFQALPFTIYYTAAQYQTEQQLDQGFASALILLLLASGLLIIARIIEITWRRQWQSRGL